MAFNFTQEAVYSCTECTYCSTRRHFKKDGQETICPLCREPAKKTDVQDNSGGMSDFEYRQLLDWLQENRSGIGPKTIEAIKDEFPQGDEFVEACEHAYREGEYDRLTDIHGIGEAHARNKLALGLSEKKGWEDGKAESIEAGSFTFRKA